MVIFIINPVSITEKWQDLYTLSDVMAVLYLLNVNSTDQMNIKQKQIKLGYPYINIMARQN